ncbi:ABC transporter ATP-binding protein [Pseudonocardia eucalypti]|uniref:Spermidine/putrescine import ATP-binding protein PotA n=1 Tax=Pseudonocardia eucalypti TaxID=648755 RepID=A0ABP9QPD6_9PSEU|nr:putative spermidine/putrescine transport system ATP-binding protein [Pseudonocardia eucalypti]
MTAPLDAPARATAAPAEPGQIEIRGVSKAYPRAARPAVRDVSLSVASGEFMTFLGPSGSGKTTMLSILAGFITPTAGSIAIDGVDVGNVKPHRRNLGVVFQQYALFPHMTVRENVAYPLQQRKVPKGEIDRRVAEVLDLVRLPALAGRKPAQLSGGEQQRVALARAVVYTPRALLLDEPLGALDKKLRDGLQREIARMHRELGMTFIFVTHDQEEALGLSDRVAVFNEGRVEQVGPPTDLYEHPASRFVAEFLGESNIFTGDVDPSAGVLGGAGLAIPLTAEQSRHPGRACVVIRPERMVLHAAHDPVPESSSRIAATVTDVLYVGNRHRIGLRFPDGTLGSAMRVVGAPLPAVPGENVQVSWHPDHQTVVTA